MKILLVSPCPPNEQRHQSMDIPQLTLPLIAGMTPAHHEVEICEEVYGDVIDFEKDVDVVGISIMTQTCLRGYEIANEFRKRGKKVIIGGIHATCLPDEAKRYADAVVIGEAEGGLWESVLEDIEKGQLKEKYKLDSLPDLQDMPVPRRDLVRCRSGKFSIAPIETTRGCPYNCDFCTVSRFFGTKQRHKSIPKIIEEAKLCTQKYLFFLDDNITGDRKFAKELFTALIPLKKKWVGQASIGITKDPELMDLAKKSGCQALLIGFESMTDEGLNQYRKSLKTIKENIKAVQILREHGILTMASLIFGLDSDTEEVFQAGQDFISDSKSAFFQSCVVTPYPGTPVFEKMKSEGRILTDNWSKYDATKVLIQPVNFSPETLLERANATQDVIFGNWSIMKRSIPNLRCGFIPSVFYYSLNRGYKRRHNVKKLIGVQYNEAGIPVDFNTAKYVMPWAESVQAYSNTVI